MYKHTFLTLLKSLLKIITLFTLLLVTIINIEIAIKIKSVSLFVLALIVNGGLMLDTVINFIKQEKKERNLENIIIIYILYLIYYSIVTFNIEFFTLTYAILFSIIVILQKYVPIVTDKFMVNFIRIGTFLLYISSLMGILFLFNQALQLMPINNTNENLKTILPLSNYLFNIVITLFNIKYSLLKMYEIDNSALIDDELYTVDEQQNIIINLLHEYKLSENCNQFFDVTVNFNIIYLIEHNYLIVPDYMDNKYYKKNGKSIKVKLSPKVKFLYSYNSKKKNKNQIHKNTCILIIDFIVELFKDSKLMFILSSIILLGILYVLMIYLTLLIPIILKSTSFLIVHASNLFSSTYFDAIILILILMFIVISIMKYYYKIFKRAAKK